MIEIGQNVRMTSNMITPPGSVSLELLASVGDVFEVTGVDGEQGHELELRNDQGQIFLCSPEYVEEL